MYLIHLHAQIQQYKYMLQEFFLKVKLLVKRGKWPLYLLWVFIAAEFTFILGQIKEGDICSCYLVPSVDGVELEFWGSQWKLHANIMAICYHYKTR